MEYGAYDERYDDIMLEGTIVRLDLVNFTLEEIEAEMEEYGVSGSIISEMLNNPEQVYEVYDNNSEVSLILEAFHDKSSNNIQKGLFVIHNTGLDDIEEL